MSTYSPRWFDSIPRNFTRSRSPKLIVETACSGRIDLLPDHRRNQGGHQIVVGLTLRFAVKEGRQPLIHRSRNRGRWTGVFRRNSSPTPPAASAQPPEIEREPPGNRVGSAHRRIPGPLSSRVIAAGVLVCLRSSCACVAGGNRRRRRGAARSDRRGRRDWSRRFQSKKEEETREEYSVI
ncbi:unnamed protein product [Cuscuta campestris]|uniref:Uncharacterized protein n=1 Tax=Cuscuta campestris TaxID=132261 RepID=A0A484LIH5_9ASTE|nr:unnamed protein product [Cuscuta campestris]